MRNCKGIMTLREFLEKPRQLFPDRWLHSPAVRVAERIVNCAAIVLALAWLLVLARSHLTVIAQPGPQELNEPAAWYATWLLDHGRNPYAFNELPGAAQFFGPLYNYVVLALKPVLGIDYTAHRLVNLLCMAGTIWLLVSRMVRAGTSIGVSLLAAALLYWLCVTNIMVTARPDALGMFLFVLGVVVAWERGFKRGPAILGLACALLAFHCKAYFALAGITVLLGVACHGSKREAFWLGTGFLVALVGSTALLAQICPAYFFEVYIAQYYTVMSNSSDECLAKHTIELLSIAWPCLVLLAFAAKDFLRDFDWKSNAASFKENLFRGGAPLTASPLPVLGIALMLHYALIHLSLGRNGGADFTYYLQLLFPFMFLILGGWATNWQRRLTSAVLMALCVQTNLHRPIAPDSAPDYAAIERKLASCDRVLGVGTTADILARQGQPVTSDGFTNYIQAGFRDSPWISPKTVHAIEERHGAMFRQVEDNVLNERYDIILTANGQSCFCDLSKIRSRYVPREQRLVATPFFIEIIQFWYPKHR
jgi:hypothetical protein